MNLKPHEAREWVGRPLHDSDGEHVGDVSGVYFNDADGHLEWVSIAVPSTGADADARQEDGSGPESDTVDMTDSTRTSDSEGVDDTGVEQRFVPAGALASASDRLTSSFGRSVLDNQPHIEARDGALSNAQVARLHEFFHTFDGTSRITTASEGEPAGAAVVEGEGEGGVPFTGRHHEPAFGTGSPGPREPHDVTLQGTGNPAP